jgi:hypothetical protein
VQRLELARVRVCHRCGRSAAELRGGDGQTVTVQLDPIHARNLTREPASDDVPSLTDVVLERLTSTGLAPHDVVLDVLDGHLRALLSLDAMPEAEVEVVGCTAEEGVVLALRGGLRLYATDEALEHAAQRAGRHDDDHGGPDTLH